jgi:hypothetical protein
MLDTLPERVLLARQQNMAHQDFLPLVLSDEATRMFIRGIYARAERYIVEGWASMGPRIFIRGIAVSRIR